MMKPALVIAISFCLSACAVGDDTAITNVTGTTTAPSDTGSPQDTSLGDTGQTTNPTTSADTGSPADTHVATSTDTGSPATDTGSVVTDTYTPPVDTYVPPKDTYVPPPDLGDAGPCTPTQTITNGSISLNANAGCVAVADPALTQYNCSNVGGCTLAINGTPVTISGSSINNSTLPAAIGGAFYFQFSGCSVTYVGCSLW